MILTKTINLIKLKLEPINNIITKTSWILNRILTDNLQMMLNMLK